MENLVNPEFDFTLGEKTYRIRKATLDKAIQYQNKIKELSGDPAADLKLVAFCVYIVLKDKEPELTEDQVIKTLPADLDILEYLTVLGFMSPTITERTKKVQEAIIQKVTNS